MRKFFAISVILVGMAVVAGAQDTYEFTTVKELKITPVKNQSRSSTCWSFSGVGLLEAELLRIGKGEYDLAEMFIVNHSYRDKAEKYVRLHGYLNFAEGGSFADVLYVLKHYGAMPQEAYPGIAYSDTIHRHREMENTATAWLKALITNPNGQLSLVWQNAFRGIIDAYLGEIPETFSYKGKSYTPKSFGESLGLNADDYISLTSYSHQPLYAPFVMEIPDNWRWAESYNLPLNEFMELFDYALNAGYTIAWAADVSEEGYTRDGLGVMPDYTVIGTTDAEGKPLSADDKKKKTGELINGPCKEVEVTPESRQREYDNYQTTDDHGMLIYGIAKDQTGKKFYMVKNSWGTSTRYKGIWYVSEAFLAAKTINITLHKNAVPSAILKKLNIK
ncbi:MAG: aminopeptidase [Tannerella sp.]|jgi:hypothetical protein|nr:aminopeptidase [Tannerella sp.]